MPAFLTVHARGTPTANLAQRCIDQLGGLPADASLGLIYATKAAAPALPKLLAGLLELAPEVRWIGALGAGVIADGEEIYDEPALSLMVCSLPDEQLRCLPRLCLGSESEMLALAEWCRYDTAGTALLHGDASDPHTPGLIEQLRLALPQVMMIGGLAGVEAAQPLIDGNTAQAEHGGVSGVLLDPQIELISDHSQGCVQIGEYHEITRAQRNLIIELDGRPALDVMLEDIGEVLARDLRRIAGFIFVGIPNVAAEGDYLVRNLIGIDQQHGLLAIGDELAEGRRLMFCRRDGNSAREDLRDMCRRLKRRLRGRAIRGGIYVSCIGRGRNQFGPGSAELKILREELGEFPLTGFFANGEFYKGNLYGYTGVLSLFPEEN
jgi:small ligand-binding sensory domain FIST